MPKILGEDKLYTLTTDDLESGSVYECDNGTIVIVSETHRNITHDERIINISNGVGGYGKTDSKFRLLANKQILLETNKYGRVID
jgi:hypothetical protein